MENELNFFERIKGCNHKIRKSEKMVADYIIKNPENVLNFSITTLAKKVQ